MSSSSSQCPFHHSNNNPSGLGGTKDQDWWPRTLRVDVLNKNEKRNSSPYGPSFDYGKAFETLDLTAVKRDLAALMTDSQDWWYELRMRVVWFFDCMFHSLAH